MATTRFEFLKKIDRLYRDKRPNQTDMVQGYLEYLGPLFEKDGKTAMKLALHRATRLTEELADEEEAKKKAERNG
jgi:hypothetical protein